MDHLLKDTNNRIRKINEIKEYHQSKLNDSTTTKPIEKSSRMLMAKF